jgi:hypothetical protein
MILQRHLRPIARRMGHVLLVVKHRAKIAHVEPATAMSAYHLIATG